MPPQFIIMSKVGLCTCAKTNTFSNVAIMGNCLRSGVLEGRKVPIVSTESMQKVLGSQWDGKLKGSVKNSLKSYGKKLPLSIQKLMEKMGKHHTWPTPGPHSLFLGAASSTWLFRFWDGKDTLRAQKLSGSDLLGEWVPKSYRVI